MGNKRFIEINVFPPEGVITPPNSKTLILICGGTLIVVATGGVAAGVMMSGGTWAVFGATALANAKAAGAFVSTHALRGIVAGGALAAVKSLIATNRPTA